MPRGPPARAETSKRGAGRYPHHTLSPSLRRGGSPPGTHRSGCGGGGGIRPLLGIGVLVLLLGAYAIDYRTHSGMTSPPGGAIEAPAYRWLAENGRGPVAELPYPLAGLPQAIPDLIATAHWRPILGGFSGFEPPAFG